MIVLSPSLILSASLSLGANNPLLGWRNLVTEGGVAADSAATGYPVSNVANPATYPPWRSASADEQYLTIHLGSADVDYVGIAAHNLGSAHIPVSIEGLAGPTESWTELVPDAIYGDDRPLLFRFPTQPLSDIRIRLQAGAAPPEIAVVKTGVLTIMPRRIYVGHTPITDGRRTDVANGQSESGQYLGRLVTGERLDTSAKFENLPALWYREEMRPFLDYASRDGTFFFAWRPSSYPKEVGYSWLTGDVRPQNQRSNGMMSVELSLAGLAA